MLPNVARYQLRYIPMFIANGYIIADFYEKVKTFGKFFYNMGRRPCFSPFLLALFFPIGFLFGFFGIENT